MTDILNYFLQFFYPQNGGRVSENKLNLLLPTFPQFIISRLWWKEMSLNKIRNNMRDGLDFTRTINAKFFIVYSFYSANLLQINYNWDNQ
jgi:hypothetical protein